MIIGSFYTYHPITFHQRKRVLFDICPSVCLSHTLYWLRTGTS